MTASTHSSTPSRTSIPHRTSTPTGTSTPGAAAGPSASAAGTPFPAARDTATEGRLRTVLLVDGVGTACVGLTALLAAVPLGDLVATPGWLRAIGVLFVVVGLDMLIARRLRERRLALAATVLGEVDLAWAAGTTVALVALGAAPAGTAIVLGVAATCVLMGTAKLVLARRLRT